MRRSSQPWRWATSTTSAISGATGRSRSRLRNHATRPGAEPGGTWPVAQRVAVVTAASTSAGFTRSAAVTSHAAMSTRAISRITYSRVSTWPPTMAPTRAAMSCQFDGISAVWGIGRPSGRRKIAVTANQSARPPTMPASAMARIQPPHHVWRTGNAAKARAAAASSTMSARRR